MREYKFRAWSNHYKKFESYSLDQIISGKVNLWFFKESPVINQFTGLQDKNKKDIYESDVVKFWGGIGYVSFNSDMASYGIQYSEHDFFSILAEVEVIGNQYENPELITK